MTDDPVVDLVRRRPATVDGEPEQLRTLLELLDRPDRAVPTIRVSGGHGRGSVVAMVTAVLSALDVTTGALTTSHLQDLRERVRIAGGMIPAEALRTQLAYLEPFLREVDARFAEPLGFDDVLTALAAAWFADAPTDVVVAEGAPLPDGRSDLRVVLDPRRGTAIHTADGDVRTAGRDFGVGERELAVGGQRVTLRSVATTVADVYLPLHGAHQADNAAVALAVVDAFLGFAGTLDGDLVRDAFARVRLPGRLEVVRRPDAASVLLDAARDPVGARALAAALAAEFAVRHRVAVLGAADADAAAMLPALAPTLAHVVLATGEDAGERAPTVAADLGLPVERAATIAEALSAASGVATTEDVVVVTGSAQTVGAARRALGVDPVEDLLARA